MWVFWFQEIGTAVKGFAALTTFKELFSGVNPLVLGRVRAVPECLPVLGTLGFSNVDSLVTNRICLKMRPTFSAFVGLPPLEGVNMGTPSKSSLNEASKASNMCFSFSGLSGLPSCAFGPKWVWLFFPRCLLFFGSVLLHVNFCLWGLGLIFLPVGFFILVFPG